PGKEVPVRFSRRNCCTRSTAATYKFSTRMDRPIPLSFRFRNRNCAGAELRAGLATRRKNDMPSWQLLLAFLGDLAFGDPPSLPHPVRLFGFCISQGERLIRRRARSCRALFYGGAVLVLTLTCAVSVGTWLFLRFLLHASPTAGALAALYLAYSTLS